MNSLIVGIQQQLERVYCLEGLPRIEHFLLHKESMEQLKGEASDIAPQVIVQEDEGELFMGVYLGDQHTKGNLEKKPEELLWPDFCEIAEEVSHFIYLSWSAQNSQPRSLLDLELQGEVDKYLLSMLLLPEMNKRFADFFETFTLRPELSSQEQDRYKEANKLAAKFVKVHMEKGKIEPKFLDVLRQFYRRTTQLRISELSRL